MFTKKDVPHRDCFQMYNNGKHQEWLTELRHAKNGGNLKTEESKIRRIINHDLNP